MAGFLERSRMVLRTRRDFLIAVGGFAVPRPFGRGFSSASMIFSVTDFHAKGDGKTVNTRAIQQAIDACSKAGGGTVLFPRGDYVSGTIFMRSGVTVELAEGATILGSLDASDYQLIEPFVDGVGTTRGYALLGCVDARAIGIRGLGRIDGRGAALQASAGKGAAAKPFLLLCLRTRGITIAGVRLVNSSAWTMHLSQCSDVSVTGVSIRSVGLPNNDGIDIDSSQRVRVEGCTIETGDDAICLKTTSPLACREIDIKDCVLTTRCAAFKIGTESAGDFSAIHVSNCHVLEANLGAIKILSVDGAEISGVLVEKLRVESADTPIFLRLGNRGRTFRKDAAVRPPGRISDVTIRDVEVMRAKRIGIMLSGIPDHAIEGVSLERIHIQMTGEPVLQDPADPPEAISSYPEVRMFGSDLPAYRLFARHANALELVGVQIAGVPGDARQEFVIRDEHPSLDDSEPSGVRAGNTSTR